MITISREQWDRMGQDSFDARLIAIIRRNHPEQAGRTDFADLTSAIRRQTAKARCYGLNDERSAATYVYTAWLLGEEFDSRIPAIAQILGERKTTAADKAAALGNFSKVVFHTLSARDPATVRTAETAR
jgi:hypothetical protein